MAKFSTVHDADDHSAIEVLGLTTAEMDDSLVLAPDGAGGVEFRAETGGGGSTLVGGRVVRTAGDVSTNSTSFVDATGLTLTLTTGAHRCLVGFVGSIYNSSATGHVALTIAVDGADEQEVHFVSQHATTSEGMNGSATWMTGVLTAASHTIKLRVRAHNTGTATIQANASQGAQFWVAELDIAA